MLGVYLAYTIVSWLLDGRSADLRSLGFWLGVLLAALAVGVLGALIEWLLLRRIYRAPELFQLLATFALVLIIRDAALGRLGQRRPARAARAGPARLGRDPRAARSRSTTWC